MKNLKIVVLTTLATIVLFAIACNKTSVRSLSDIQETGIQSVSDYKILRENTPLLQCTPDISSHLVFLNNRFIGISENCRLITDNLSFEDYTQFMSILTARPVAFDIMNATNLPYPAEKYQEASFKQINDNTVIVKPNRVPDCSANPKDCPCKDTDMDATCIELPIK